MTTQIVTRIDTSLKEQVTEIFDNLGLRTSTAIYLFLKQVVLCKGMPFELKLPNTFTLEAIKELESGKGIKYNNPEDFLKELKG